MAAGQDRLREGARRDRFRRRDVLVCAWEGGDTECVVSSRTGEDARAAWAVGLGEIDDYQSAAAVLRSAARFHRDRRPRPRRFSPEGCPPADLGGDAGTVPVLEN